MKNKLYCPSCECVLGNSEELPKQINECHNKCSIEIINDDGVDEPIKNISQRTEIADPYYKRFL